MTTALLRISLLRDVISTHEIQALKKSNIQGHPLVALDISCYLARVVPKYTPNGARFIPTRVRYATLYYACALTHMMVFLTFLSHTKIGLTGPNACLGLYRKKWCTFHNPECCRYIATLSAGNLKPRPSATRSALIGYFGLLGLIATMRKSSFFARKVRP